MESLLGFALVLGLLNTNVQLVHASTPIATPLPVIENIPIIPVQIVPIPPAPKKAEVVPIPVKKSKVKITLADLPPILRKVAKCESGGTHTYANGKIVTNKKTHDFGLFQINIIHLSRAKALGYNIFSEQGNIGYALHLYHQNGLSDWVASRGCWSSAQA